MGIVIKSFDVGKGDFFLIKVSDSAGKYFNLMVDCGKKNVSKELKVALNGQRLNGIVITHVDNDHIIGVIDLVEKYECCKFMKDVFIIYNKYDETLITYDKGNKLYEEIKRRLSQKMLLKSYARNYSRENKAIECRRKKDELPVHILSKIQRALMSVDMMRKDNVYITLLSPNVDKLKKFMRDWKKVNESAVKIQEDRKLINQSSITFLLEFNGKRVLMLGDGFVSDVFEALKDIKGVETIDYVKLAHHGAGCNNKGIEKFYKKYSCEKYGVTIEVNQDKRTSHPNRDIINILVSQGCHIYTSTNFQCTDPTDCVHMIEKQSEIFL